MDNFAEWVILSRTYLRSKYEKNVETVQNQLGNFGCLILQKDMDILEQFVILSRTYLISRYMKNVMTA